MSAVNKFQGCKPCHECPFRKEALPGWLGGASHNPQVFLSTIEQAPIPCHLTVDWDALDEAYASMVAYVNPCIGSLQFMRNTAKLPWDKVYATMRNSVERNPEVFEIRQDFIDHHTFNNGTNSSKFISKKH